MPHGKRSGKGYCVCSTSSGRCFFPTDDIIIPETAQHDGDSIDGWTIATSESTASSPKGVNFEEDWWVGGGDVEEAPNNWAGCSYPVASEATPDALRTLHLHLNTYVGEELP
jgi:hypothetical protein